MSKQAKINMLPIELVPLANIKESSVNTKIHTQEQVNAIKASIMEFGFNDPIAIDENMEIVEGHGRFQAVTQLGGDKIPCIRLDQLSESQVRAYRIAHNKITMQTGFDMDMLMSELTDLNYAGFDINVTGFTLDDLDLGDVDMGFPTDEEPEEEDEPKKKATSSVVQYIMIFDDESQQKDWYKFLKHLRHEGHGETIAEKVMNHIKDCSPEIFE